LPEHFHFGSWDEYLADGLELADWLGCHLVAGSAHRTTSVGVFNSGAVFSPRGSIVHRYEKVRPYGAERQWVQPGHHSSCFELDGHRISVFLCADFWFTDLLLKSPALPHLALVPALSVTRKASPAYSRSLWRHTAIARAYEYGMFVGISDWAQDSLLPGPLASGVAGFADPTTVDPTRFFRSVSEAALIELDFARLHLFRQDRRQRGFFWEGSSSPENA